MLRPSSSNPELPPMLRPERDSVLGRAQLSPSSSASPGGSSLAIPGRSSLAIPGRSSLASPVRPSVASPVRSSLAERGRHRSFSRLCPGQIVFERTGPFQAATLLLTCRFTYSLASSRTYLLSSQQRHAAACLRYSLTFVLALIYTSLLVHPDLQDAMLRLIVQQLVHHIPGHAHGKEVYLPGEVCLCSSAVE